MRRRLFQIFTLLCLTWLAMAPAHAEPNSRFFLMGDGTLVLNGKTVVFRGPDGKYLEGGLKQIHQIFKAPFDNPEERLSLRFIEVLDYLQDQLSGKSYWLRSGYRSPRLNQSLRNRGKLAAQSSMHVEGAAGDLVLGGVPSSQVFDFIKALDCCGIGWYHSEHFHLDTGPSRYWDEKTSKTEDKTPQQNEKIILQTDLDRYLPGETMDVKLMRITEYPIGVAAQWSLVAWPPEKGKEWPLTPKFSPETQLQNNCPILTNRSQARQVQVSLPEKIKPTGKYALKVGFCQRFDYAKMPEMIYSRPFEIISQNKGVKPSS